LFGIEEGIATGVASRIGIIEYANGGTILLDEVGDIPLNTQAKLLRVLQEKEFVPVGSDRVISVKIRIIATSTPRMEQLIDEGKIREDFFYRISGLTIHLPPLRKRTGDIVLLARTFLQKYNKEFAKDILGFKSELFDAMLSYHWPGNVRELDHMVRKAVLFCHHDRLALEDMDLSESDIKDVSLSDALKCKEREYVREAFEAFENDYKKSADALGISVKQLKKYLEHNEADDR
jgi:two-component system, NtrC family, response regulator